MGNSRFWDKIKDAANERQVEDVYNEGIRRYFKAEIKNPFQCDGYIDCKTESGNPLRLIIEYKYNENLDKPVSRAKVLAQVLFYLKKFDEHGDILPNVCLVGDLDECFVMHTNALLKYLDEDIDWSVAPSKAAEANPDLVQKISNDKAINPFVFDVNGDFSFKEVADKITDQANNIKRYVHITEHNLSRIFDYFCSNVLDEKSKSKLSAHDLVEIFMGVISNKMNYYQHRHDPNTLVYNREHAKMDGAKFNSFFSHFDREYTPQETMRLKGIGDRLLEDMQRRMNGDYWTPTLFVDYAHRMLEEVIGEDWRETCVVWDNCWGTGNLTRDFHFGELYCSTLHQSELNIGADYNPEATKFQFDFLNDYIPMPSDIAQTPSKLPHSLIEALQQDKPIVFFLNPPYARNGGDGIQAGVKETVADTFINHQMKKSNIGACSANLYGQFLYRIMIIKQAYNLKKCYIGLFSPTLFLTGSSWSLFRKKFFDLFSFEKACQFRASHFADVKDTWGISFSIWKSGYTKDKTSFLYDCIDDVGNEIKVIDYKIVYNIDDQILATNWANQKLKGSTQYNTMKSALKIGNKIICSQNNILSWFTNGCNNVNANPQEVYFMSCPNDRGKTNIPITEDNFTRCTALFSARKLIEKNWINSKDEYLAPNENHPKYEEFVNDSIVHSLFHSSSQQSSLRQIEYKGKMWDIKNEFFWMSRAEIEQLANDNRLTQTYNDARTSKDRYVYTKLQGISLSPEAQAVLDKACEIVRNTFRYRSMFDSEHPEYQIMNWDCGWYQVGELAYQCAKTDYNEFVKLFKALEEKMRPMVYELGFLR